MGRSPCCDKVGMRKGRWTAEEDDKLREYVRQHGEGSWRSLPKNAGLLRCGKSCRLRWINYLRDDLKRGKFSKEEEDAIVKLHATIGNRWSVIAGRLPGRTDNEIKNYWNSHLRRKIHSFWKVDRCVLDTAVLAGLNKATAEVVRRKGGRTSRSNMKKINITIIKNNNTYVVSETTVVETKKQTEGRSIVTTPAGTVTTTTMASATLGSEDDTERTHGVDNDGTEEVILDEGLINELLRCIDGEENKDEEQDVTGTSNDGTNLNVGSSLINENQVDALFSYEENDVGSSTNSSATGCGNVSFDNEFNMQGSEVVVDKNALPGECTSWMELDSTPDNLWEEEDIWPMVWADQGMCFQSLDAMDEWLFLEGV